MSGSSSGLRGVTLNDLFVVPAKRATDMRSLGEAVAVDKKAPHKSHTLENLRSAIVFAAAYVAMFSAACIAGEWAVNRWPPMQAVVGEMVSTIGASATVALVSLLLLVLFLLVWCEVALQIFLKKFPFKFDNTPPAEDGHAARVKHPNKSISFGTLKVTYAIQPDALVVRSLNDHSVSVFSMDMLSCAILGDPKFIFANPEKVPQAATDEQRHEVSCRNELREKSKNRLALMGIGDSHLKVWSGAKNTHPVIVVLKSGDQRIPLIIHGLYFDGTASAKNSNARFVEELNVAIKCYQDAQHPCPPTHGHNDHGGHGGGHH